MFARFCGGLIVACAVFGGCASDPFDFGEPSSCSVEAQNEFVYDLMRGPYLWSPQVPDVDPSQYDSPEAVISDVRYEELDRWSRLGDRETSAAFFQEGRSLGLGYRVARQEDESLRVAYVNAGSPAAAAGIRRGDTLLEVGDQTRQQLDDNDGWNAATGPAEVGVRVRLLFETPTGQLDVEVSKAWYDVVTVPTFDVLDGGGRPTGYLVFNTFLAPSEAELDAAFASFADQGVRNLILDLRYNGGGRISTAQHLMNLISGQASSGQVSYKISYGPALETENTSRELAPVDASLTAVDHLVVLTTGSTASASELVINGLTPHVRVSVVGTTTAGKPVGSRQWEFCDKVAFPITFRLLNADDRGDYFAGIAAQCAALDSLDFALGDPQEPMLAAALAIVAEQACPLSAEQQDSEEQEADAGTARGSGWTSMPTPSGAYPGIVELRHTY